MALHDLDRPELPLVVSPRDDLQVAHLEAGARSRPTGHQEGLDSIPDCVHFFGLPVRGRDRPHVQTRPQLGLQGRSRADPMLERPRFHVAADEPPERLRERVLIVHMGRVPTSAFGWRSPAVQQRVATPDRIGAECVRSRLVLRDAAGSGEVAVRRRAGRARSPRRTRCRSAQGPSRDVPRRRPARVDRRRAPAGLPGGPRVVRPRGAGARRGVRLR